MEDGLTDEIIKTINEEMENMCIPAQYELIAQLQDIKPNKKKDFVKKYLNNREKLKDQKVKLFAKLSKEVQKKKNDNLLEYIGQILEIDVNLKLDIFGTIENLSDMLQNITKDDKFNTSFEEMKKAKLPKMKEFGANAEKLIGVGKFYDAAFNYREAARLARLFSTQADYDNYIKLAEECDSFAANE